MTILEVGTIAPEFELQNQAGDNVRLSDYLGKQIVLYFFPRADTPGCIVEACEFRDDHRLYVDREAVIIGVSHDNVQDEAKFIKKYNLPFTLLADSNHAVSELYGVWVEKKFFGREFMGIKRTTYIIDKQGIIESVFEKVSPKGHSKEVLEKLNGEFAA